MNNSTLKETIIAEAAPSDGTGADPRDLHAAERPGIEGGAVNLSEGVTVPVGAGTNTASDRGTPSVTGNGETSGVSEDPASGDPAEFEELIRGKYRDAFNAKVKDILVKRFRQRAKEKQSPAADVGETGAAPEAAGEGEVPGDALRLKRSDLAETAALARDYPAFDPASALSDPQLIRLLDAGFGLREALLPRARSRAPWTRKPSASAASLSPPDAFRRRDAPRALPVPRESTA